MGELVNLITRHMLWATDFRDSVIKWFNFYLGLKYYSFNKTSPRRVVFLLDSRENFFFKLGEGVLDC